MQWDGPMNCYWDSGDNAADDVKMLDESYQTRNSRAMIRLLHSPARTEHTAQRQRANLGQATCTGTKDRPICGGAASHHPCWCYCWEGWINGGSSLDHANLGAESIAPPLTLKGESTKLFTRRMLHQSGDSALCRDCTRLKRVMPREMVEIMIAHAF